MFYIFPFKIGSQPLLQYIYSSPEQDKDLEISPITPREAHLLLLAI